MDEQAPQTSSAISIKTLASPEETGGPLHTKHQVRRLHTLVPTARQAHGVKGQRPAGMGRDQPQSREGLRAVTS